MSKRLDILISRHLDGGATDDNVRELDELLKQDPRARRALVLAAAQDVHLKEVFASEATRESLQLAPEPRQVRLRLAAAAAVVATGSLLFFMNRYPAPVAYGSYTIESGRQLQRGSVISTDVGRGTIALGGYCRVGVSPHSTVHLEGEKYAEQLFLAEGAVQCEADRGVGRFTVRTEVGAVAVKGTQFEVQVVNNRKESEMLSKRMVVSVLTGTVLVTGTWGQQTLRAGQQASLPPPGDILRPVLKQLGLGEDSQAKVDKILSPANAIDARSAFRTEVRGRIFDAARLKLQTSMPAMMPTKVMPKVRAIRAKKRVGGPPSPADIALIQMASQKRARKVLMEVLHQTADTVADEAAVDDRLIAWHLAKRVRTVLPGDKITAFDAAVADAGIVEGEPALVAKAEAEIDAAIAAYDPDMSGILDPETGNVTVSEEELGIPARDDALASRIIKMINDLLPENVAPADADKPLLSTVDVETARLTFCTAVRARLFEAARKKQAELLPQKMPSIVESKVMAVRMRVRQGGPPSASDIAQIQRAVMRRTSGAMREQLHAVADAVAVRAARDEKLVAAVVANSIKPKLEPAAVTAFDAALAKAGITANESAYLKDVQERIATAIETVDPDLTGIVNPATGKVTDTE